MVSGEGGGKGEGLLFVSGDDGENSSEGKVEEKERAGEKGPDDLTEEVLVEALVALIEWEDSARALRRQQEDVVKGLEGMGMGGSKAGTEARGVVGRLGGVMGRVAVVRWGLEDCLVVLGEGV